MKNLKYALIYILLITSVSAHSQSMIKTHYNLNLSNSAGFGVMFYNYNTFRGVGLSIEKNLLGNGTVNYYSSGIQFYNPLYNEARINFMKGSIEKQQLYRHNIFIYCYYGEGKVYFDDYSIRPDNRIKTYKKQSAGLGYNRYFEIGNNGNKSNSIYFYSGVSCGLKELYLNKDYHKYTRGISARIQLGFLFSFNNKHN